MLLVKLWNYLRGYVIIKITGEYVERLLNQAAVKGVFLWDVRRLDGGDLMAMVGIRDFASLRHLARKTRCRLFIVRRAGIFFMLYRLRKRKVFLAGAVLFVAAVYLLSSFIWTVDININAPDPELERAVKTDLRTWGLKEGTFKYKLDKKYYLDKILQKYREVAWGEIQVKGSRLIVELVKKKMPPVLEENTPCDIIASKDGIIEEIIPLKGEALVKPGDTVSAGDVLITGRIKIGSDMGKTPSEELLVHARGIVKARTWYQKVIITPLVKEEKVLTGRVKKAYRFQMGENVFRVQWGHIPFETYDTVTAVETRLLPELKFSVIEYREVVTKKEFLGVEKASREAEKQLMAQIENLPAEVKIIDKKMDFTLDSEGRAVLGSLTLEVIEDIGKEHNF